MSGSEAGERACGGLKEGREFGEGEELIGGGAWLKEGS